MLSQEFKGKVMSRVDPSSCLRGAYLRQSPVCHLNGFDNSLGEFQAGGTPCQTLPYAAQS